MDNENGNNITDHPLMQSISHNIGVISLLLIIFVLIGCVAFFSYEAAYSTKIKDRRENAMLYEDSLQNNILGAKEMPEVELFKPRGQQQTQAQQMQMQQQMQQQQSGQTMLDQKKQAREAAQVEQVEPTQKPTPTNVPDNVFINAERTLSFTLPTGWNKSRSQASDTAGVLSATVQSVETSKELEAFIKEKPFGREPKDWEEESFNGESGFSTSVYSYDPGGAPSRSISAFVQSKDGKSIIAAHVDSKNLDVNDSSLEEAAKKIHTSIQFLDKEEE